MIKLPPAVHLSLRLPLFIYCNLHANFDNPVKKILIIFYRSLRNIGDH